MAKGGEAIEALAGRFPQLYVAPAEGAQEAHRLAAGRGIVPEGANLDHFSGDTEDMLYTVDTPAGPVDALFLKERADFETFLRIVGNKSKPVEIARSVGAITYRGLADWGAVARAKEEYLAGGGDDWASEFGRLASAPARSGPSWSSYPRGRTATCPLLPLLYWTNAHTVRGNCVSHNTGWRFMHQMPIPIEQSPGKIVPSKSYTFIPLSPAAAPLTRACGRPSP